MTVSPKHMIAIIMINLIAIAATAQSMASAKSKVTILVEGMMKSKSGATWMSWPDSVSAALLELASVSNVEVDLEEDKFTVSYDAKVTSTDRMKQAIISIGYRPTIVQSLLKTKKMAVPSGPIPEPIASILETTGKLVLVDFYAQWCGACKLMELTTLKDPVLLKTLERFHFTKIDADEYPDVITHFRVVGMPTYIVLNKLGEELYRQVGPIDAIKFDQQLSALADSL